MDFISFVQDCSALPLLYLFLFPLFPSFKTAALYLYSTSIILYYTLPLFLTTFVPTLSILSLQIVFFLISSLISLSPSLYSLSPFCLFFLHPFLFTLDGNLTAVLPSNRMSLSQNHPQMMW